MRVFDRCNLILLLELVNDLSGKDWSRSEQCVSLGNVFEHYWDIGQFTIG